MPTSVPSTSSSTPGRSRAVTREDRLPGSPRLEPRPSVGPRNCRLCRVRTSMSSLHPLPLLPYRRVTSLSLESWSGRQSLGDKSNSLSPIDLPNARDSNHGRTPANQRVDVDRALDGGREAAVEPEVEPVDVDRALTER